MQKHQRRKPHNQNKNFQKKQHKRLQQQTWATCNREEYWKRYYYSQAKKRYKRYTNKRIRSKPPTQQINNGAHYRKFFDYWWSLF